MQLKLPQRLSASGGLPTGSGPPLQPCCKLSLPSALNKVPQDSGKPSHMRLVHLDSTCTLLSSATEFETRFAA